MAQYWTLTARPKGMPKLADFALAEAALPVLEDGMVQVRNRWLSVDPNMRGRMNDAKSYAQPYVLVDAALAGFDAGELVTIPSVPDVKDWEAFEAARAKMGPNLSRNAAAARYKAA